MLSDLGWGIWATGMEGSTDNKGASPWVAPALSLSSQLQQEVDRRKAAKLSHHELSGLVDKLILDWYAQTNIIGKLLVTIQRLEVDLALAQAKPSNPKPSNTHMRMAIELLRSLRGADHGT